MDRVTFLLQDSQEPLSGWLNPASIVQRRITPVRERRSLLAHEGNQGNAGLLVSGSGATEIELDLLFDTSLAASSQASSDVRDRTRQLWTLTERPPEAWVPSEPPRLRMIWGKSWNVPAVILAMAERLEHFDVAGRPRRSWLRLRLRQVPEPVALPALARRSAPLAIAASTASAIETPRAASPAQFISPNEGRPLGTPRTQAETAPIDSVALLATALLDASLAALHAGARAALEAAIRAGAAELSQSPEGRRVLAEIVQAHEWLKDLRSRIVAMGHRAIDEIRQRLAAVGNRLQRLWPPMVALLARANDAVVDLAKRAAQWVRQRLVQARQAAVRVLHHAARLAQQTADAAVQATAAVVSAVGGAAATAAGALSLAVAAVGGAIADVVAATGRAGIAFLRKTWTAAVSWQQARAKGLQAYFETVAMALGRLRQAAAQCLEALPAKLAALGRRILAAQREMAELAARAGAVLFGAIDSAETFLAELPWQEATAALQEWWDELDAEPPPIPMQRLDVLAHVHGGDPRLWRSLAVRNGVDDPLAVPADWTLTFPEARQ